MDTATFYIQVITTSGTKITSDPLDLRSFVADVFSNSPHLTIESCWGYVEAHISKMIAADSTVFLTVGGNRTYFNPRHIEYVKIIILSK